MFDMLQFSIVVLVMLVMFKLMMFELMMVFVVVGINWRIVKQRLVVLVILRGVNLCH